MALALREPGLSQVVEELIGFRGADIHVHEAGDLTGRSFAESVFRFTNARPIGRIRSDGTVVINPAPETRFDRGDRLVVIADDDQAPKVAPWEPPGRGQESVASPPSMHNGLERVLIIGWNALGAQLIAALGNQSTDVGSVHTWKADITCRTMGGLLCLRRQGAEGICVASVERDSKYQQRGSVIRRPDSGSCASVPDHRIDTRCSGDNQASNQGNEDYGPGTSFRPPRRVPQPVRPKAAPQWAGWFR
jgi:hypothetical protein